MPIIPRKLLIRYRGWLLTFSGRLVVRGLCEEHEIYRYANGVDPRAILALAAGALVARVGSMAPGLRFLFDGAWFPATLVSFAVYHALMRPAPAGEARLAPAVPRG